MGDDSSNFGLGFPSWGTPAQSGISGPSTGNAGYSVPAGSDQTTAAADAPISKKTKTGAIATVAGLTGLLIVGNLAQQKAALPVGDGVFAIRPFNVVATTASVMLGILAFKYVANKFPVAGFTDIVNAV